MRDCKIWVEGKTEDEKQLLLEAMDANGVRMGDGRSPTGVYDGLLGKICGFYIKNNVLFAGINRQEFERDVLEEVAVEEYMEVADMGFDEDEFLSILSE